MIKFEIVLAKNDVMTINEELKKLPVGGVTVLKKRGRGKNPPPEIHASKGTEVFTPQFDDKYVMEVVVDDEKEDKVIEIVRKHAKLGKIFIFPVKRAVDIATGEEESKAIN